MVLHSAGIYQNEKVLTHYPKKLVLHFCFLFPECLLFFSFSSCSDPSELEDSLRYADKQCSSLQEENTLLRLEVEKLLLEKKKLSLQLASARGEETINVKEFVDVVGVDEDYDVTQSFENEKEKEVPKKSASISQKDPNDFLGFVKEYKSFILTSGVDPSLACLSSALLASLQTKVDSISKDFPDVVKVCLFFCFLLSFLPMRINLAKSYFL